MKGVSSPLVANDEHVNVSRSRKLTLIRFLRRFASIAIEPAIPIVRKVETYSARKIECLKCLAVVWALFVNVSIWRNEIVDFIITKRVLARFRPALGLWQIDNFDQEFVV